MLDCANATERCIGDGNVYFSLYFKISNIGNRPSNLICENDIRRELKGTITFKGVCGSGKNHYVWGQSIAEYATATKISNSILCKYK